MTNKFEISGPIVSYGTTNGRDYLEILTDNDSYSITVYLQNDSVNDLERKYGDLTERNCNAAGFILSYPDTDYVSVIATRVKIR